ncbi:MAG: hypothetical protein ACYDEP_02390 [Acidimicrobiales bacterium]
MNASQYDAERHAESQRLVDKKQPPLLRMEAPTLTINPDACVTLALADQSVRIISVGKDLDSQREFSVRSKLDADKLALLFRTSTIDVLFADRKTVSVAARTLASSDNRRTVRIAKIITYLSKCPAINQCSVLTTALGRKYWTPGSAKSVDDISRWATYFRIPTGTSRYAMVPDLIELATTGSTPVFDPKFRSQSQTVTSAFLRGNKANADAFSAISHLCDTWTAVENADPVLYQRGILTGQTPRIVPRKRQGSGVVAAISTPMKLRVGNTVLLFGHNMQQGLLVVLASLEFDMSTSELLAVFDSPRKSRSSNRKTRTDGFDVLWSHESLGHEFYAINQPYIPWSSAPSAKSATSQPKRGSALEIPLDVALAAAN